MGSPFFAFPRFFFRNRTREYGTSSTCPSSALEVATTRWASPGTTYPGLSALPLALEVIYCCMSSYLLHKHIYIYFLPWFMCGVRDRYRSTVTTAAWGYNRLCRTQNDLWLCTYTRLLKRPGEPAGSLAGLLQSHWMTPGTHPKQLMLKMFTQNKYMLWQIPYADSAQQTWDVFVGAHTNH